MTLDIPFDAQLDSTFHRMCGAACLSMIYKYYGISDDQNTVWQRIAQPDNNGNLYARTFRLCADLLCNGIHSVIIKAVNPLRVLSICNHNDFSAILCYRLNKKSNAGHFTVFEKLKKEQEIFLTARAPKMPERSAPSLYGRSLQENWIKLTLSSF